MEVQLIPLDHNFFINTYIYTYIHIYIYILYYYYFKLIKKLLERLNNREIVWWRNWTFCLSYWPSCRIMLRSLKKNLVILANNVYDYMLWKVLREQWKKQKNLDLMSAVTDYSTLKDRLKKGLDLTLKQDLPLNCPFQPFIECNAFY